MKSTVHHSVESEVPYGLILVGVLFCFVDFFSKISKLHVYNLADQSQLSGHIAFPITHWQIIIWWFSHTSTNPLN